LTSIEDILTMALPPKPASLLIISTRNDFSVELALKEDPATDVTISDATG
jgi:hypothetical protein